MTIKEKDIIPVYEEYNDDIHKLSKNNVLMDKKTGRIVSSRHSTSKITPANSAELRQVWTREKFLNKLTGMASALNIEIDTEDYNDIVIKSDQISQKLWEHLTKVFIQSDNIHGLSQVIDKLMNSEAPEQNIVQGSNNTTNNLIILMSQYIERERDHIDADIIE